MNILHYIALIGAVVNVVWKVMSKKAVSNAIYKFQHYRINALKLYLKYDIEITPMCLAVFARNELLYSDIMVYIPDCVSPYTLPNRCRMLYKDILLRDVAHNVLRGKSGSRLGNSNYLTFQKRVPSEYIVCPKSEYIVRSKSCRKEDNCYHPFQIKPQHSVYKLAPTLGGKANLENILGQCADYIMRRVCTDGFVPKDCVELS